LFATPILSAYAQTGIERGSYLVNTIMTCGNCHSPKGPPEKVAGKDFSGGLTFDTPGFTVTAPNITQHLDDGIGKWSHADIKRALIDGVRPDGVPLAPIMPSSFYAILTSEDAEAVVGYLKSLEPVGGKVADPAYKQASPLHRWPGTEKPYTKSDLADPVKLGFYLVSIGHCMECHTPMEKGQFRLDQIGKGGREIKGPWGVSVSRNITSSKSKGIGAWTDAQVKAAITTGVRPDGSKLKPPMGFAHYAQMAPRDVDAVVVYLRTVPTQE
jgi:mono/diheme cytochrome c family protein